MARNYASFLDGFTGGLGMAQRMEGMVDQREMRDIAKETPEESTGFTEEQGAELEKLAATGEFEVGYDESKKAYTLKPKDGGDAKFVEQQGVTDFLGKRTAGKMSSGAVDEARQLAMADVVGRRDPMQASRMRSDIKQSKREDERYGWEQKRAQRDERRATDEDANTEFMKNLEADVGQQMTARLTGPDGQTRPASVDDYLAASQYKAAKLIAAGKTDAAQAVIKDHAAQSFVKIQLENAVRDKALGETIAAVNAGNLEAAGEFYNRFLPDGGTVTGIKRGESGAIVFERKGASGEAMPPATFKDANQLTASLSSLKDPMAVYNYSQNEFRNSLAIKADSRADRGEARADRAEGRSAASFAASMADRGRSRAEGSAKDAAAVNLYKEMNPGASEAQIEAVRRGILPAVPSRKEGGYKVEAGDVSTLLGTPAVDNNGNALVDPMTGRQVVNRNPEKERALFEFMRDNGITDTNEGLQKFLAPRQGSRASSSASKSPYKEGTELRGKDGKTYIVKNGVPVLK
jgi:hypothetical protein